MKDKYPFKEIEEKWRKYWERNRIYEVDLKNVKKPFYNLMMFPYPSAEGLHVGNVFAFVGSDIQGRFHRMHGYDVFEPIGFDAFGIHSENFAMKTGSHPARLVPENILNFRENQLKKIGNMYDWSHSVDTTTPDYYRWTQWIFLRLYKAGFAYRAKAPVNWCPSCKTVLASEQVINNGCERCSTPVVKRELTQWFFRITEFAEELLNNLDNLQWSERTKIAQKNWIGRSEGAQILFSIAGHDQTFEIFTTRPDTLFGVTYMVVAPEHPMLERIVTTGQRHNLEKYKEKVAQRSEMERQMENTEKEGVFTGAYAINPVNDERIPVWVSDYVLMGYGTGAIMAVPAHDQRDFEFAKKYDLEIRPVISPDDKIISFESAYTGEGVLVNSGHFNNLTTSEAARRIVEWLKKHSLGKHRVQYRLRDWCISRQRYWGPPIPIIYCDTCGTIPVPERELPVLLPEIEDYMPDGSGDSPLLRDEEFFHAKCPRCGGNAVRETDVSDNFLCSSWYFLRYPSAQQSESAFDSELTAKWLPIDLYVGGNEHAVLHLLYSRFLCMALNRIGLIDFEEPYKRFIAHGLIVRDGVKMSKSKGNVINPVEYIERYGADTIRVYLMFMGDYLKGGDFCDDGIKAMHAFLERIWKTFHEIELDDHSPADSETLYWLHSTIKAVTVDIRRFSYNTALARLMELFNFITANSIRSRLLVEAFIKLLSPFAPHISEELWTAFGHGESITNQSWPDYREEYTTRKSIEFVIQINGKVRAKININKGMDEQEVEALVLRNPVVRKWIKDRLLIKKVFVPDRLVNLVIK